MNTPIRYETVSIGKGWKVYDLKTKTFVSRLLFNHISTKQLTEWFQKHRPNN